MGLLRTRHPERQQQVDQVKDVGGAVEVDVLRHARSGLFAQPLAT